MKNVVFKLILLILSTKILVAQPQVVWEKNLGGSKSEFGGNGIRTSDGGYLFTTGSASDDGDLANNFGDYDVWVVKTDAVGNIQWSKNFGGSGADGGASLAENSDSSFWAIGSTWSADSIFSASKGTIDVFVLKISAAGDLIFAKTFGGTGHDNFYDFEPTDDGGLLFTASTWSNSGSGDVIFNHGDRDCWLVKLDADGQIEWQKAIGGSKHETLCELEKAKDGGFWLAVRSDSSNGDFPQITGANNTWVLKLDDAGTVLWKRQIAQENNFVYPKIKEDLDGNLVLMMGFAADWRTYLLKFDENGNKFFEKAITEAYPEADFEDFEMLADGSFLFFGRDSAFYPMLVRSDFDGNFLWKKTVSTIQKGFVRNVVAEPGNAILLVAQGFLQDSIPFPNLQADHKLWVLKLDNALPTGNFFAGNFDFKISPNPIFDSQPLQISLENDFFGTVKFEILSLDGRVLQTFFEEKTSQALNVGRVLNPSDVGGSAFFVRVSDGKTLQNRLVLKF